MRNKRLFIAGIVLTAVFLLAACGSSEPAPLPEVALFFTGSDDFNFTPDAASVKATSIVTVNFENGGVLEHSWILVSDRVAAEDVTEQDALGGATTGILPAGETKSITFAAPPPGTYQIVCAVPGHAVGGMVGTFTVTDGN